MRHNRKSVTIIDVANVAGVSVSTVSRVLNNKDDVAPETYERVRRVVNDLGYASSLAARSMRSRKTNLLGLVVPDIGYQYSIEIMKGVNRAIAESEFDLLLYTTGDVQKSGAASHEQYYISLLNKSITDGVLIVASAAADFTTDAPIVSVDPHVANPNYPSISATNYEGALDAMEYLLSLGHRRIGFISGRQELDSAERRMQAYQDAMQNAGIDIDPQLIATGDYTTRTAYKCTKQLLSLPEPPTAIFAANDQSAIGLYEAAKDLGVRIPDELSVVGFDNISEAKYMGLTTVDQRLSEMGYIATQMLIKLANGEDLESSLHKISTELVVRDSCKEIRR
jgi:LacI family transcriptional regulator